MILKFTRDFRKTELNVKQKGASVSRMVYVPIYIEYLANYCFG